VREFVRMLLYVYSNTDLHFYISFCFKFALHACAFNPAYNHRFRFYLSLSTLVLLSTRDIKPENCLLDGSNVLKLADLGGAVHALHPYDVRHTLCGTPEYLAPEVLAGRGYKAPVDSWACGVLFYELFFGASPFRDKDHDRIYANIASFQGLACHLSAAKRKQLPCDDAYQLMEGLLSVDSDVRLSPDTAASCPWLNCAES